MTTNGDAGRTRGAIVGLGLTDTGKVYGRTPMDFAGDAVQLALDDAGLARDDLDGLLLSSGITGLQPFGGVTLALARDMGLEDLSLMSEMSAFGATAIAMVIHAMLAVEAGLATTVACVWADAPLAEDRRAGASLRGPSLTGFPMIAAAAGLNGANPNYALAARRHMATYGTTSEQLGSIAVQTRAWATMNPQAQMRDPITLDDHHASRVIAEPLRLLDCCLVSNGGAAVIVTSAERAAGLRQPPVHALGFAQAHPGYTAERGSRFGLETGAKASGKRAMKMAGIVPKDIDLCELYDCYTFTTLISLEDYGFCEKGEGGPFAASGALGPGGALPTNTGGGQLSSFYLWGMTPLVEAVIQTRGQGGERQVGTRDVVLVSGNGGTLDHHGTLILSPHDGS